MFPDGVEPPKIDLGKVLNGGDFYCSLTMGSKEGFETIGLLVVSLLLWKCLSKTSYDVVQKYVDYHFSHRFY